MPRVTDFSENITLYPQDEIESAHWTQQQVTLVPIFIVRHAPDSIEDNPVIMKESVIVLSDHLTHDASAVYVYTQQLLRPTNTSVQQSRSSRGWCGHRFTDNCAVQFKSIHAFGHLPILEEENRIKLVYHFTESGHGKGPSDGLGASTKKNLSD